MSCENEPSLPVSSTMPLDELQRYAVSLGIPFDGDATEGELLRRIRARQVLLGELDREAMLDVCVWARRPVRESAEKEELARDIATIRRMKFDGLSDRGLSVLCRLREVEVKKNANRTEIIRAMKKSESWGDYVHRKFRRWVGGVLSQAVFEDVENSDSPSPYQFLPEPQTSLKDEFEEQGVVGGLTRRLRVVADDYVREKLDEIESRIDRKLDEIDRRLSEWRDREVRNRLRIIKITLAASVVVALLSLGYDRLKHHGWSLTEPASVMQPESDRSGSSHQP